MQWIGFDWPVEECPFRIQLFLFGDEAYFNHESTKTAKREPGDHLRLEFLVLNELVQMRVPVQPCSIGGIGAVFLPESHPNAFHDRDDASSECVLLFFDDRNGSPFPFRVDVPGFLGETRDLSARCRVQTSDVPGLQPRGDVLKENIRWKIRQPLRRHPSRYDFFSARFTRPFDSVLFVGPARPD